MLFTHVGFPKQIVSDQGTTFVGKTQRLLVGMQAFHTTVYHPQTNGLVELFNETLKRMVHKFIHEGKRYRHKRLPFLMCAVQEATQASLGVLPVIHTPLWIAVRKAHPGHFSCQ